MKFRKKPVVIEAEQCFLPDKDGKACIPDGVYEDKTSSTGWSISTLEGKHEVSNGDWIITGIKGEKYPCKPDIFEKTYTDVDSKEDQSLEEAITETMALFEQSGKIKRENISDGYHTFKELYDHRITLFIALCNLVHRAYQTGEFSCWKARKHSDGSEWDGWFIAGINTIPGEQLTYHIPIERWAELDVHEWEKAPEWDGHTPADVLERIKKYLY